MPTVPSNYINYVNATVNIDFGDGSTLVQQINNLLNGSYTNIVHTYNAAGTYIVSVSTTNSFGCTSSSSDTVTVVMPTNYNCDLTLQTAVYSTSLSAYAYGNSINVVNYAWDFGDGTLVNNNSSYTNHVYQSLGTFNVCVTATTANGCVSSACDTVTVNNFGTISGYTNAFNYMLPDSSYPSFVKVILLQMTSDSASQTTSLYVYDAVNTTSYYGFFEFNNVPSGPYTLLTVAYADSANVDSTFVPTYYTNKQHWYEADTVYPSPYWQPYYLDLLPTYMVNGSGQIGGFIGDGNFKSNSNGVEKVHVVIYNENEEPVKHVLTDAQGRYTFKGLSMGTYHIYPEVLGMQTYRATVTISDDEASNYNVDFEMGDGVVSGITRKESNTKVGVYPNPARSFIQFNSSVGIKNINITDITGKVISQINANNEFVVNCPLQSFSSGLYFYQVEMKDGSYNTGKFNRE
jgi:hypothetical protein